MLIIAAVTAILIALVDQLIKLWITRSFSLYEERPFLQIGSLDVMHLHYIENNGSAFSSFSGQTVLLLIVTAVGMGICGYVLVKKSKHRPLLFWSLTMILGGAMGNMIDRMFRGGSVVDYLDLQLFQFAIFNFADCFITVGTALLAVYILFFMERDDKRLKAAEISGSQEHFDDPA